MGPKPRWRRWTRSPATRGSPATTCSARPAPTSCAASAVMPRRMRSCGAPPRSRRPSASATCCCRAPDARSARQELGEAAAPADAAEGGAREGDEAEGGEPGADLALLLLGADARAERLVDLVERVGVLGRERLAAGELGHLTQGLGVGRDREQLPA